MTPIQFCAGFVLAGLARAAPAPQEWVELDVRLPDGTQAPAARIVIEPVDAPEGAAGVLVRMGPVTWTPDQPGVDVPNARVYVQAFAGADDGGLDGEYASEAVEVDGRVEQSAVLRLGLLPRVGVRVSLTLAGCTKLENGRVLVAALDAVEEPDLELLVANGACFPVPSSEHLVLDLEPGRYVAGAAFGVGLPVVAHEVFHVREGMTRVDLVLDPARAELSFRVELLLGKEPFPKFFTVEVSAIRRSTPLRFEWLQGRAGEGSVLLVPDAAGLRLLQAKENGEPGAAAAVLLRYFDGKDLTGVGAPLDRSRPSVRVSIDSPACVLVTLRGEIPQGLDLMVMAAPRARLQHWLDKDKSSARVADGEAVIGPLPAAPYDLVLRKARDGVPSAVLAVQPVELVPGDNRIALDMPGLFRVEVRVHGPARSVELYSHESGGFTEDVESGTALFDHVPAGDYWLTAQGAGPCRAALHVPPGGLVHYRPPRFDALEVRVIDPAGPARSLGFEDGDRILGIDGAPFNPVRSFFDPLEATFGRRATFRVLRNDEEIDFDAVLPADGLRETRDGLDVRPGSTEIEDAVRIEPLPENR